MHPSRVRTIAEGDRRDGPVVYWMSRDQRAHDNWALIYAAKLANIRSAPLAVAFCLQPQFLNAALRHYAWLLRGLGETAATLAERNIAFVLLRGEPAHELPQLLERVAASALVTDFSPLRIKREWTAGVAQAITIPFFEVDAHNVMPCWEASSKQEIGARTLRPKLLRRLDEFLDPFPVLGSHPVAWPEPVEQLDWAAELDRLPIDRSIGEIRWATPGEHTARKALDGFLRSGIERYGANRNDATVLGQSDLSPFLHYGQLAPQRLVMELINSAANAEAKDVMLDESVVRRELAENYCFYNPDYDNPRGFPEWASVSLREHQGDKREHVYTCEQLERAETHDPAWNAAQIEMVRRGKTHGYTRMYWCKKILEWTESPAQAMEYAVYLNDRYQIDGRDPNGYTNIAWSLGGVHDKPWPKRPIFGNVRYMSFNGLKSKFDVDAYTMRVAKLTG